MPHHEIYTESKKLNHIPDEYKKNEELLNIFILSFFEEYGQINFIRTPFLTNVECLLKSSSKKHIIEEIHDLLSIKSSDFNKNIGTLKYSGINCTDFLYKIYHGSDARFRDEEMYSKYLTALSMKEDHRVPFCKFIKADDRASIPSKSRASDIGYDLTIVEKIKDISPKTAMYDTHIRVQPCLGYYTKIVPRSSLSKSGYILANSIGIIDPSYTASLKIVLTKIDDSLPDLKLPFKCCQLILDRAIHYEMEEVLGHEFLETERGDGGFGSTDRK